MNTEEKGHIKIYIDTIILSLVDIKKYADDFNGDYIEESDLLDNLGHDITKILEYLRKQNINTFDDRKRSDIINIESYIRDTKLNKLI